MFDIAWSELLVVGVVAWVVVGPKDLPKLMRTAGQWAGRARAMADQFRRSFDEMAREPDEMLGHVPPEPPAPRNTIAPPETSSEAAPLTPPSPPPPREEP